MYRSQAIFKDVGMGSKTRMLFLFLLLMFSLFRACLCIDIIQKNILSKLLVLEVEISTLVVPCYILNFSFFILNIYVMDLYKTLRGSSTDNVLSSLNVSIVIYAVIVISFLMTWLVRGHCDAAVLVCLLNAFVAIQSIVPFNELVVFLNKHTKHTETALSRLRKRMHRLWIFELVALITQMILYTLLSVPSHNILGGLRRSMLNPNVTNEQFLLCWGILWLLTETIPVLCMRFLLATRLSADTSKSPSIRRRGTDSQQLLSHVTSPPEESFFSRVSAYFTFTATDAHNAPVRTSLLRDYGTVDYGSRDARPPLNMMDNISDRPIVTYHGVAMGAMVE